LLSPSMAFKCVRWTLANVLPVGFVIWVICTLWSLYVWLHLLPLLQLGNDFAERDGASFSKGLVETTVSQLLALMLIVCFVRSVTTDPGSVPQLPEWSADCRVSRSRSFGPRSNLAANLGASQAQCLETKQSGERRFCKWCENYKPDRCHHCRVCKSCILRMDHHCPWIVNCVGFRNHKYFFLLVFYALLNLVFILATMTESMSRALTTETPPMHRFLLVFCMTLASLMGLLLVVFFWMHVWLMLTACTTIEFCEKRTKRSAAGVFGTTPSYDRGFYQNVRAVLGPIPLFWLLPMMPPNGDGLYFPQADVKLQEPDKADNRAPCGPEGCLEATSRDSPPEVTGAKAAVA